MSKKVCTYNKNLIPDENLPPNKSRDLLQSYFSFSAITLQACDFTQYVKHGSSDSAHKNTSKYISLIKFTNTTKEILIKTKSINCEIGGDLTVTL